MGLFFDETFDDYERKFENGGFLSISGIEIAGDRIKFDKGEILFEDLDLKRYHHYFMVFSKKNPHHHKML
ncbi:hypothetical protein FY557_02805 [Chryseobacterium sp. SN22]|uniref:hypothetical protein n=1 Tax=Chryseobacterium sp. SN22 TaxID=2606431 RepID=UPI0011ED0010|nr:hypothetical protein [Chryseobacterium sp. SN22]KAA0130171.1 hypothetical protein FY557_02805 [Chryseobacterium sp. SN22]